MATKGFKGAAILDVEKANEAQRIVADRLKKEAEEALKQRNSGPKGKAPIVDGLNVLIIVPSYNEENSNFIRLSLFHFGPFSHVCSRPAPIFDPDDTAKIIFSKKFRHDGDANTPAYHCNQCSSAWNAVAAYMKENGIKKLEGVPKTSQASQYYSANKAVIQGIFQGLNVSGFFTLDKGKTIPTLDQALYNKWFTTFMDIVIDKVEPPEDMPENLATQAKAGLQILIGNQALSTSIKNAVYTKYEESGEYPLHDASKYLVCINQSKDSSKTFDTKDGKKEANAYVVSCFLTNLASGKKQVWEIPDRFYEFVEEKAEDIYNINYEGDKLEAKALAYHPLEDDELETLCKKYGVDIVNNVNCAKANKKDDVVGHDDDEEDTPSTPKYSSSKNFDESDDDEDDDDLLNKAKARSAKKS